MTSEATKALGPSILLIHGPNLNLLGTREPEKYGKETMSDIEQKAQKQCSELGLGFDAFQSNHEGALIDRIHAARADGTAAIVINAGVIVGLGSFGYTAAISFIANKLASGGFA